MLYHRFVEGLERDRRVLVTERARRIPRAPGVGVADDEEGPIPRARHQPELRLQRERAGALGPDQRAGHIEAVLREELVEVVAGDPAGDLGEARADLVGVAVAERSEPGVDLGAAPTAGDDGGQLLVARRAHPHAEAIIGQDLQLLHIVHRLAAHDGVGAAGVVADHPAEGAVGVGRGVGREGEAVDLGGIAELIADHAGLDSRCPGLCIDLHDPVQILRKVEDDGDIAGLPGEARPAAAAEDRDPAAVAGGHGGDDVVYIMRDDHADRDLAVEREVCGVERAARAVEADLALDCMRELGE
jgi:hypothetical protein